MLKAPEQAPLWCPSVLDRSGLPDPFQRRCGYRNSYKGFHLFASLEYFIGGMPGGLKIFLMVFPDHPSDNASQLQISPGSDDRIFRIGSLPINLAVEHQLLEEMKKVKTGYRNQRFVFVSVRSCQLVHFPAAG